MAPTPAKFLGLSRGAWWFLGGIVAATVAAYAYEAMHGQRIPSMITAEAVTR